MSEPSIADAKALALTHRKRGVIVLAFDGKQFSAASYGMTRSDCRAVGRTLDQICDRLVSGAIAPAFDEADKGPISKETGEINAELLAALECLYGRVAGMMDYSESVHDAGAMESARAAIANARKAGA